jgi:hypothetical protein
MANPARGARGAGRVGTLTSNVGLQASADAAPTAIGGGVTKRTVGTSIKEKDLVRWGLANGLLQPQGHPLMRRKSAPVTGASLTQLLQHADVPAQFQDLPPWFLDPATQFRVHGIVAIRMAGATEQYQVEWVDNDATEVTVDEQLDPNDSPPTVALPDQYRTWEPLANIPGTAALINQCREAIAEATRLRQEESERRKQAARDRKDEDDARREGLGGGRHKGQGTASRRRGAQATAESTTVQGTLLDVNWRKASLVIRLKVSVNCACTFASCRYF